MAIAQKRQIELRSRRRKTLLLDEPIEGGWVAVNRTEIARDAATEMIEELRAFHYGEIAQEQLAERIVVIALSARRREDWLNQHAGQDGHTRNGIGTPIGENTERAIPRPAGALAIAP